MLNLKALIEELKWLLEQLENLNNNKEYKKKKIL